jgi:N-acetyl-gamma-glutamyl-phosphate reductase
VLLPLLPFADIVHGTIVTNALSGVSGAGRKETLNLLFNERSENVAAYSPGRSHRHVPEMDQALRAADTAAELLFTPHLVPIKQGMLATTVATLRDPLSRETAEARIRSAYENAPFVGLSPRPMPETKDVRHTNRCDIAVRVEGAHLYLFSVIDNLYKGAAGQGVQNMNVRLGLPETAGLRTVGEF